jgi:transcriptional antiterminator
MSKTIKQIADELGVSKQAVTYRIKQLEATKGNGILAVKENGILVVSLAAEKLIKSAFSENDRQTFGDKAPPNNRQKETDILAVLQTTIDTLQGQLAIKDRQIDELTATVKIQAQSINAAHQTELAGKFIEGKQILSGGADPSVPDETPPKKQGLFSRFRKGKVNA